jgi:hypothetical protein
MSKTTSFAADIRPLFTDRDVQGMKKGFNLASYDEVNAHALAIYDRIRGIGGAVMPPPPPLGEGPWPQSRIDLFCQMAGGWLPTLMPNSKRSGRCLGLRRDIDASLSAKAQCRLRQHDGAAFASEGCLQPDEVQDTVIQ